jgi:serine protease
MLRRSWAVLLTGAVACSAVSAAQPPEPMVYEGNPGGPRLLEEGQPVAIVHATVEAMERFRRAGGRASGAGGTASNLAYRGGTGGVGVESAPRVYLILWGSQWRNDPSGEAAILENFYSGVGSSTWSATVTQYCQGVIGGTVSCNGAGTPAGNPSGIYAGVWNDTALAPSHPRQSQIAAEAVRAAVHFGNTSAGSNANIQYVIATATRNNSSGFGSSYCAYHSSTSSGYGNIAYTNLPYMTDAGVSCGAGFNGLGPNAGITIVSGHELAETITDPFPNSGWLDANGAEIGDKCAWISSGQGASASVTLSNGLSYPVQSLWSNAFNLGAGGCVLSYP